ncbi:MAG TPA: PAS domain S-box protein [Polyangiales bacterium]|nr:PAS domain S-box protein [Polyangiales bacterium]
MSEHPRIVELENEVASLRRELTEMRLGAPSEDTVVSRLLRDRAVLETLPDVVLVLDRQYRILYINRSALPDVGVETLQGKYALDYIPEDHRAQYRDVVEECWRNGVSVSVEVPSIADFWWETRLVPFRVDGEVIFIVASSADITQRKRAERELRESEMRLRLALDATGMGTWSWDALTNEVLWDPSICQIYGVEFTTRSRTLADFLGAVHPDDRGWMQETVGRRKFSGVFNDIEFRIQRPDGEVRNILSKGTLVQNDAGEVLGFRGGVFDVTARKRMEEQLNQRQKMEAIGQLTAGIAHNFNNLLSVILPNVSMARSAEGGDELALCLEDIDHAARRAADMVQQLMLFARRGPGAKQRESIDLGATVARTVQICRTTFDRAIRIELTVQPNVPPVSADPGQIEQVLLNICINARDALEQGGTRDPQIHLDVERTAEGRARVRVFDNGPGMDEQTRKRVFEPFFTTKEIGRGTGLGLASAYAIVTEHHGQIICQSELGVSTLFELELPAAETPIKPTVKPTLKPVAAISGSETVLLIDDEPLVRRAAAAMLAFGGYRVLEADGGSDGLDIFMRHGREISLVLLDRSMPGLPGEQVALRLRELDPHVPIVLLSGQPGPAPAAAHAAAVLSKPVDAQTLLSAIRDGIDRSRRERG